MIVLSVQLHGKLSSTINTSKAHAVLKESTRAEAARQAREFGEHPELQSVSRPGLDTRLALASGV